jgi:hypothetical protein
LSTICRVAVWAFVVSSVHFGCATEPRVAFVVDEPRVIDLPDGAVELLPDSGVFDSPVLSPDGKRLAVQVEVYRDRVLPYEIYSLGVAERNDAGRWSDLEIIREGIYKKYLGRMENPIQPSFDQTGDRLVLTHLQFDSVLSIPSVLSIRTWIERVPWRGGDTERLIEGGDWGLRLNEIIQHARISPDGRWLTFYVRVHEHTQGVYLLDMTTGEHHRLGSTHDKHPTWAPSGRRIYFHTVIGGKRHRFDFFAAGEERSYLGYYALKFEGDRLIGWDRHLFDEPDEHFVYHKHPAEVAGTGLLFFHGRLEPEDNMKLMVRKADPGSEVFVVKTYWQGKRLKAAKHPCSSFKVADLVYIGKPKGEKTYRLMMSLTEPGLAEVRRVVYGTGASP